LAIVWYLLVAASAGVFLHAGIKFPWFVFFQKDSGLRPSEPPWNMRLAMILFAVLCIGIGVMPEPLYALLPFPVDYVPYTAHHVVFNLQALLFSGFRSRHKGSGGTLPFDDMGESLLDERACIVQCYEHGPVLEGEGAGPS